MKLRTRHVLILFSGLLLGAVVFEGGPSTVIFPRQVVPIRFDHNYHTRESNEELGVKGEGLSCEFCHENVGEQAEAGATDIPGHETCENCHGDWIGDQENPAPVEGCLKCHSDFDPTGTSTIAQPMVIPPPNVIFGHDDHVKAEIACTVCHSQVPQKTLATRDDYPTMDRCVKCHQIRGVSTDCKTCHFAGESGRLVTSFPQGQLKPVRYHSFAAHTGDFLRDHSVAAQQNTAYCKNCHATSYCLDCHDGVNRDRRYHPGDWIAVHGTRSRIDDFRCQSCHRLQSYCLDCHVKSGVASIVSTKDPFTVERGTIRRDRMTGVPNGPHPMAADGWLTPNNKNFHGFHAQRAIRSCASCHQEQYCVRCHGSGFPSNGPSFGGNPHGSKEKIEALRSSAARSNNARACLKCHSPFDTRWR